MYMYVRYLHVQVQVPYLHLVCLFVCIFVVVRWCTVVLCCVFVIVDVVFTHRSTVCSWLVHAQLISNPMTSLLVFNRVQHLPLHRVSGGSSPVFTVNGVAIRSHLSNVMSFTSAWHSCNAGLSCRWTSRSWTTRAAVATTSTARDVSSSHRDVTIQYCDPIFIK